jgi:hypothetical protein
MSVQKQSAIVAGMLVAIVLLAASCNVFSFNGPSGDAQLLSAARACFDSGDLACALQNYQKLSSNDADIATSEEAFTVFDQQGASMSNLMQFIGDITNLGAGPALTNFGQRMNSTSGVASRVAIWTAFYSYRQITDNPSLSAFVQFLGALSLTGELLAETQGTDSALHKSDFVTNATACATGTGTTCATGTACNAGTSLLTSAAGGAIDYNNTTQTDATAPTGALNADFLYFSIESASSALVNLGGSGKYFGNASALFSNILGNTNAVPSTATQVDQCFRFSLLSPSINIGS